MTRFLAVLWLALLALAVPVAAQNFPERGNAVVVDQAGLLRPEQALDLTSKSEALYAATGRRFAIATVKNLEGQEVQTYATDLFRKWGIGDKQRDDGVLLLVAPTERKVWIATGYGAEGFLPDILIGRITREIILPRFKAGDLPGGIMAGADAIMAQMKLPEDEAGKTIAVAREQDQARQQSGGGLVPLIIPIMIFAFVALAMVRGAGGRRYRSRRSSGISPWIVLWGLNEISRGSRRGGWGGGGWGGGFGGGGGFGSGGGFGGFGGGSSGGGGAGGSW